MVWYVIFCFKSSLVRMALIRFLPRICSRSTFRRRGRGPKCNPVPYPLLTWRSRGPTLRSTQSKSVHYVLNVSSCVIAMYMCSPRHAAGVAHVLTFPAWRHLNYPWVSRDIFRSDSHGRASTYPTVEDNSCVSIVRSGEVVFFLSALPQC